MVDPRRTLVESLLGYIKELRFPWLLAITIALFLLDVAIPDVIPVADEILLGLVAAMLATLRKRKRVEVEGAPPSPEGPPGRSPAR